MHENRGIWRGKRTDTGEWVKGNLLFDEVSGIAAIVTYVNLSGSVQDLSEINIFQVDPETLGECAGMKDKNSVKIFEGDIVLLSGYGLGKVEWSRGLSGFFITINNSHFELASYLESHLEVIGNVHDNSELLKTATGEDIGNAAQDTLISAT